MELKNLTLVPMYKCMSNKDNRFNILTHVNAKVVIYIRNNNNYKNYKYIGNRKLFIYLFFFFF